MRPTDILPLLAMTASIALATTASTSAAALPPITLWPNGVPGASAAQGDEVDTTKPTDGLVGGKRLIRLGNVAQPTLTVYRPDPAKANGTAVLVCPGGGYHILALDLEGTEVCEWLNSIGVTAGLLKYRVPRPKGEDKPIGPLMDAQRALGILRKQATELGIHPDRIGVLGFSAGGHLAAAASTAYGERKYAAVDAADAVSCRPDFTVLIYPAYLTQKDQGDRVSPELTITSNTPPTFISISQDDPVRVETALGYATALQQLLVPMELHIYPKGGHGYGLRRTEMAVTSWPDRATDWLRSRGLLERP